MDQNQDLQSRIHDLKQALDRILQENAILRKKCESEKYASNNHKGEVLSYKQALFELESTMIEMTQPS